MCTYTFLGLNGYELLSNEDEADELCTKAAKGEVNIKQIAKWLNKHSVKTT